MSWCYQRLPWPAGVVFRPLLMTPGDDLGGRVVVLVTDQIWTIVLAMFLNNCHSTWGDGRQPLLNRSGYTALSSLSGRSVRKVSVRVKRGNLLLKVCAKSHHRILTVNSIPCKTGLTEREEVIAVFETELEGGAVCFSWCARRSNPRVSFSPLPPPPASSHAAVLLVVARVNQEVV